MPEGQARVDRSAGVIYGVRVCGLVSENKRRYTPESLRKAIPLYEGAKVKWNHRKSNEKHQPRDADDTFGWLEGIRQGPDGALYGDLHFLTTHEKAEKLCEAAEKNPRLFGLSHEASGEGYVDQGGVFIVESVTEIVSVDVVDGPATNTSLFESKERPSIAIKVRDLLESVAADRRLPTSKRVSVLKLLEKKVREADFDGAAYQGAIDAGYPKDQAAAMARSGEAATPGMYEDDPPGMDMEVPEPPAESDPRAKLAQCVGELAASGSADDHELAKKIMNLLKPESAKPETETATEQEDEGEKDKDKKDDDKDKKKEEAKKPTPSAPGSIPLTESRARSLSDLAGVKVTADLLEAAKVCVTEEAFFHVLKREKAAQVPSKPAGVRATGPAGQPGAKGLPQDYDSWLAVRMGKN